MIIDRFHAESDLVGRRLRVSWRLAPEVGETLADAPLQQLRRKTRDFEFVQPWLVPDPYLVYDSASFPLLGPGASVSELPQREEWVQGLQHVIDTVSVADDVGGQPLERLRRTLRTAYDSEGVALWRDVEILDSGSTPLSLEPGVACYYQLFSPAFGTVEQLRQRAVATPAAPHGLNRWMYEQLPAVHRQHDVRLRPATPGTAAIPEASNRSGQLRRLLDVYGAVMDSARSSAEGLRNLHDIDRVDGRRLPHLAQWLGWRLGDADALPLARNELKATPRLYETVGTTTAVRALVTRYTGWTTRVAECVQHLVRSNDAPRPTLRVAREVAGLWRSPLDAAPLLGFGPGNQEALGAGALPAVLTSTQLQPYALFAGAELSLSADADPAWRVRFGAADFVDIGAATAAEVAAAINAASHELVASVAAGRVELQSRSSGPQAQLNVVERGSEPLTLDIAGSDRACAVIDAQGRLRVFGSIGAGTPDPSARAEDNGAAGGSCLVSKAWIAGQWRGSQCLQATRAAVAPDISSAVADPAAAVLPDQRIALVWIDGAHSVAAQLRLALGSSRASEPARIQGRLGQRFTLVPGTQLTLRTAGVAQVFVVNAADYVNPAQATVAEVVAAMNAQFAGVVASAAPDGTLRLVSNAVGPQALLAVDLAMSTCARTLGLAHAALPSRGRWDETLDLGAAVTPALPAAPAPLRPTELCALAQGQGLRLAWSSFVRGRWALCGASWLGPFELAATSAGLALRRDDGLVTVLTVVDGLPSNAVRDAIVDADGALWVATAAGVARRRDNGTWAVTDAIAGLPSDDTRQLVQGLGGEIWVATAAGLGRIDAGGAVTALTVADGLASNDVRAIARGAEGRLWIATAAGLNQRDEAGNFSTLAAPPLPAADVRCVAAGSDGRVYAATAGGLLVIDVDGALAPMVLPAAAGLDLRWVDPGRQALWLATATGAWQRTPDGQWQGFGIAQGLPSSDVRRVRELDDGAAGLASAGGAARIGRDGRVSAWTVAQGLPGNDVAAVGTPWSSWVAPGDGGLAAGARGDREPVLLREATGTLLLLWSRWLAGAPGEDRRALRARRFDPAAHSWSASALVTQPVPAGSADSQPAALPGPAGGTRVFFASNRSGGPALWELTLNAALVPGALAPLPASEEAHSAPWPMQLPGPGGVMLLYRSDGWTCSDQHAPLLAGAAPAARSVRVPEAATLRRHAGSTTALRPFAARNSMQLMWGDLLARTAHRPRGLPGEPPLTPAEFFTRGTLALYVTRGRFGQALSADNAARLRHLLAEFLPINLRAVIVLAPELALEMVYGAGVDLSDRYTDEYPFVDSLGGPADSWAAALPEWAVLLSNQLVSLAADPADLTTLRRRSWFAPPQ
ncbi:MAG: phage tail protein [Burkholderiaceae bacterium]|nr:phage tail protein [Burkholderiaceae bacterium]